MPPVLVSACLCGVPCRWHGRPLRCSSALRRELARLGGPAVVPVCPEVLGGLKVPRRPVKRRKGRIYWTCPEKEKRQDVTGADVTHIFERGARRTLELAQRLGVERAIMLRWSPSCDIRGVAGKLLVSAGIEVVNVF